MSRRAIAIVAGVVAALAVAGVGTAWYFGLIFTSPTIVDGRPVEVPPGSVQTVAGNLEAPWGIAFRPDGSALVTERDSGRILSLGTDGSSHEVARLADVRPAGEGGLLGIAVSPTFESDHLAYVYYTSDTDNRIARLRIDEHSRPPASPQTQAQPIFTGIPKAGNHNGGRIAFGPDGMLYAGTGDAGTRPRSQDRANLGGKILRLTRDGAPAPGNPFAGSPVYSYGHRNVQGLAWDGGGQLFASEFGQNRYDELNRIVPGGNYGWPDVEGIGDDNRFVNPVATWSTSDASPSGIAILDNTVYMACLRGQKLYRLGTDGKDATSLFDGEYGRLRAAAAAPDGALWILTSNRDGRGSPAASDDRVLRFNPGSL